jgi:AcrR family transcriptional regulator
MPRTPEQFEKIREEKRSQIMEVALELFSREGYHSTPISKIAREAGISKGLMYNYFDSKEELMLVILKKGMDQLAELFDPNKDGVLTGEEFDYFVERSFEAVIENPTYWRLYFGILMQAGIYEMIKEYYQSVLEESMGLLLNYYKERGVDDPLAEALLFGAVMDGICLNYLINPEMFPLEDFKQKIIDKFGHKEKRISNNE